MINPLGNSRNVPDKTIFFNLFVLQKGTLKARFLLKATELRLRDRAKGHVICGSCCL